ncbi:TetR/AcrR family transcriptional regulator [Amycolatopsis regifaucium]|uniref:TetR family transcriptional regulator n=1 Tax=Amycolatopsis regifaucium TaxID=546365 RepID=A0A154MM72_9PSEU|nr:TetR/AcrR family transcriptional regulator [Amycolatopsis regifaucium]KZB85484.1 TetR family transcriptional regulator [Amycolatopsis regifaucium]OKA03563.1 TetR family transcriptional regulator [Amycolatopsis regifaucium]SFJ50300.1 DNA-binding transcriptional regulator, AcrR family [Amycolatopsis regifaucium]
MSEAAARSPRRAPVERQRDPERTKAQLLEAAKTEFGAKGYAAARVSEIAAKAGVNKQLISYYFGGKEGLYNALTATMADDYVAASDHDQPFADVVRFFAQSAVRDRDLAKLFLWENLTDGAPDAIGVEGQREFLQQQVEYIRARQTAGDLPPDLDPGFLLVTFMAAASAALALPRVVRLVTGQDPNSAEFAEAYGEQLARLVDHLATGRDQEA